MDPVRNPYTPGAGAQPPELVGRDDARERARVALERIKRGLPNKSLLMVGLRGMGKTVLLDQIRLDAEANGLLTVRIEAPETRSLPSILAPELRSALIKLSGTEAAKQRAQRALMALAGFAKALKFKYHDIEVGFDFDPEPGLADNGDLDADLRTLFEAVGAAAKADGTGIALFVDELQYVKKNELAALIMALHRTSQERLPIAMVGAGLPQLRGMLGKAKTYAERLFEFPVIGPLSAENAKRVISKPARTTASWWKSPRSAQSWRERNATPTSCRNGESTFGTPPNALPSLRRALTPHPNAPSPNSTKVSSRSDSIR